VASRPGSQRGFSFLEVLIAMSILLLGAVSVLSLFALGVNALILRRIDAKLEQVRTEVATIAQEAVDKKAPGELPPNIPPKAEDPPHPLSQVGFGVRIQFAPSPFGGTGLQALAVIYYRGKVAKVLPPLPLSRSTLDPR
jgi:prepilin-type N-terminal cleavage/methylation domain-containing protein